MQDIPQVKINVEQYLLVINYTYLTFTFLLGRSEMRKKILEAEKRKGFCIGLDYQTREETE